ncbi:MAG: hypothetical protein EOO05_20220 [Chitinophagaceae bacterium]|nr:MAG: hypothetical protein EOO05_20220 [Chitinophagaceae bacterium]
MKYSLLLFTCLAIFSLSSTAQDKIYRQNGKVILAKVIEVGSAEVKYRLFENPEGPIYILESDRIKKIVYESGAEEKFGKDDPKDTERYADDLKKVIKVNFFSPLYGYTEIGYEKSLAVGRSIEFSVGGIGLGKSSVLSFYNGNINEEVRYKPRGFFVTGGYKFNKLPDFILFGRTRMSHLMQGTYLKPTLYLGHYSENYLLQKQNNSSEVLRQQVSFGALQLEFGKQWIFGEKVALNIYWGLGYGFDNKEDTYQYEGSQAYGYYNESAWNYANARGGKSPGLSGTFGLKLGLLLK